MNMSNTVNFVKTKKKPSNEQALTRKMRSSKLNKPTRNNRKMDNTLLAEMILTA